MTHDPCDDDPMTYDAPALPELLAVAQGRLEDAMALCYPAAGAPLDVPLGVRIHVAQALLHLLHAVKALRKEDS